MNLRRQTFRIHRWLGLVVSLQLLAWSVGGLYFTLFDIDAIRGTTDAVQQTRSAIVPPQDSTTAVEAMTAMMASGIDTERIQSVILLLI